jgi:hypothetical protein
LLGLWLDCFAVSAIMDIGVRRIWRRRCNEMTNTTNIGRQGQMGKKHQTIHVNIFLCPVSFLQ